MSRARRATSPTLPGERRDTSSRANCNMLLTIRPHRKALVRMFSNATPRISSRLGRSSDMITASTLSVMAPRGLLISWAMPAASVPIEARRSARRSARSVCFRWVMSPNMTRMHIMLPS